MPYHEGKQQAFNDANQITDKIKVNFEQLDTTTAHYGKELKHLKEEVNEAFEQINNALEVASEKQRKHLYKFRDDLEEIVTAVNEEE